MDDPQINLDSILEQAPKWTFAGDFTLLQWMKRISQDLESRATKTTDALTKLNNNIKSTNISLDNVANSLTTLQFGNQFVECRVQDDDETLINFNEQSKQKENQPETTATSKELLNTFLDNNLKILRNCHERYSIDLEDSDDEEATKEKTCIYQPINPYNEKPLPYIFGSRDWHAKWHVGLYENQQDNSYSGDDISEAFSETSTTSHLDDNESFESNTGWASSNSIDNDNFNANIEVKNASTLGGLQPFNAVIDKPATISESSSVSTTPSSMAKNILQTKTHNEILTKRSESINDINSGILSRPAAKQISSNKRENTLDSKIPKQKVIDLFAEPLKDNENVTSSSVYFDQNEKRIATEKETTTILRTQARPFVDLFAEPPEDVSSSTAASLSSSHNIKRKIVNLFDDDDNDVNMNQEELKKSENKGLTATTLKPSSIVRTSKSIFDNKEEKLEKPKIEANTLFKPIITAATRNSSSATKTSKSLFDDSDDDEEDFLKAFAKKSVPKDDTKISLSKTILFDNEIVNSALNSLPQSYDNKTEISKTLASAEVKNISNHTQAKENELISNKLLNVESQISIHKPEQDDAMKSSIPTKPMLGFLDESTVEENIKKSLNVFNNTIPEPNTRNQLNLFEDLDDEDNLFSTKPKNNEGISQQAVDKKILKKPKENTIKIVADTINIKDTKDNKIIIENELTTSDSLQSDIAIADKTKSIQENQILKLNLLHETYETKSFQTNNNDNQEQNNTNTTLQPAENEVVSIPEDNNHNKYKFNSILFSDEPPDDDDEFFETLAKTQSALNSNYNAIDLENGIFEPALPKVPVTNASNNQNDVVDNFYTGLQLFSDIPPDDDDDTMSSLKLSPSSDVNQTKRLHSVFYDDFNETLMALNENYIEKDVPKPSILNKEPPPMNEDQSIPIKDLTDDKVPDNKQETVNNVFKTKIPEHNTEPEGTTQETNDKNTLEFSNKRPVSKLKMPHININVQALLPGVSNSLRKSKEDDKKSSNTFTPVSDAKPAAFLSVSCSSECQLNGTNTHLPEPYKTAETEHILPNITKNRVKAPAARRPSTRKARQENYRKKSIEPEYTLTSDEETPKVNIAIKTDTISQTFLQKQNTKNSDKDIPQGTDISSTSLSSENQNKKDADNEGTKSNIPAYNIQTPKSSSLLSSKSTEIISNDLQDINSKTKPPKDEHFNSKSKHLSNSLFMDDDDDDDDEDADFFEHIKYNIVVSGKTRQHEENLSTKSISTTKDSLHALSTNKNNSLTEDKQQPDIVNKQLSIDNLTTINQPQWQQRTDIKISKQLTANKLNSFFDDKDDDADDLLRTAITSPTSSSSLSYKERNMMAKSQFKSFLDSETDEEPNLAGLQTKMPVLSFTASAANLEQNKTNPTTLKNDKSKLFSDSETDSDDLFGKLASAKLSNNKKVSTETSTKAQPKSSLFENESDSDDFLSSSRSTYEKATSKRSSNNNVSKKVSHANASLFSDLDSDEDDLFGAGAAKVSTTNVTTIKSLKPASTSQRTATKSSLVADNPLADLL